ncbi:CCA tRNA nucleotidyltransferase [Microvirga sp. W0021]|uniref:CCA tRNA nucleotidyltransferase n=1 Tax=Hohaiivirga grylli TaxID=3133970 RepID=A0ABV0BMP2_9HYPH
MREAGLPAIKELLALPAVQAVMTVMNGGGEETRLVGGAVRNALMGDKIADIDMATTALPDVVMNRARQAGWKVIPTGIDHGTVTVVVDHIPFEITTLREDIETDGRHAVVRFGRSFEADAIRRDFTMNALSMDISGTLHDYFQGLEDIKHRRVRFIGDAHQRIREDYLRILRFFRFHAVYGRGAPDPEGLLASISGSHGLAQISAERIRVELLKLLAGEGSVSAMEYMADSGILLRILDGVVLLARGRRLPRQAASIEKLAAYAVLVREDADRLRELLRLSNDEQRFLDNYALVLERVESRRDIWEVDDIRRIVVQKSALCVLRVFEALKGEPGRYITPDALTLLERYVSGQEIVPVFPLRGADFLEHGIPKGPEVGRLMERARSLWFEDACPQGEGVSENLLKRVLN